MYEAVLLKNRIPFTKIYTQRHIENVCKLARQKNRSHIQCAVKRMQQERRKDINEALDVSLYSNNPARL